MTDIFIPKYKPEVYIKDGEMSQTVGLEGMYRAVLRGPDGMVKSDTGWKKNTVLDYGLEAFCTKTNPLTRIALGTDNTPASFSDPGILGSVIRSDITTTETNGFNSGSPYWIRTSVLKNTFAPGIATGTIGEYVLYRATDNPTTQGQIRVAIDPPVVKGALDELTIEHRLNTHFDHTDVIGTVDISGVPYDYVMNYYNAERVPYGHLQNLVLDIYGNDCFGKYTGGKVLGPINGAYPPGTLIDNISSHVTTSGFSTNWYMANEVVWNINTTSGEMNLFYARLSYDNLGFQWTMLKQSDQTGIVKENTHELRLNFRRYAVRYVP